MVLQKGFAFHSVGGLLQATLAHRNGIWRSRSVVRCTVGTKAPVHICSLSGDSCQLDLEFEELEDVVFSVTGPRGVHLAGYFLTPTGTTAAATTTTTTDARDIDLHREVEINETKNADSRDSSGKEDIGEINETKNADSRDSSGKEDIGVAERDDSHRNKYDLKDSFIADSDLNTNPTTHECLEVGGMYSAEVTRTPRELADIENMNVNLCDNLMDGGNEAVELEYISEEKKGRCEEERTLKSAVRYMKEKGAQNEVAFGNNEEHINEKINRRLAKLDQILSVQCSNQRIQSIDDIAGLSEENRSVPQSCNSLVPEADANLGDSRKQKKKKQNSAKQNLLAPDNVLNKNQDHVLGSNEGEILKENGYVSASWNSDESQNISLSSSVLGARDGVKLKEKKRKKSIEECQVVEDDVVNDAHKENRHPRQVISSSIPPRKKLKKVKVGEATSGEVDLDLPDDAYSKLEKESLHPVAGSGYTRSHTKSKKEKKKKSHERGDGKHLAEYVVAAKNGEYIIKERKKEISKEKAIVESERKEEKLYKELKFNKSKGDLQNGNPKGLISRDLGCELAINSMGIGSKMVVHKDKSPVEVSSKMVVHTDNSPVGVSSKRKLKQSKMLADCNEKVAGSSVPQQKKLKKVNVGESSLQKEKLDLAGKALDSHSKIKNRQVANSSVPQQKKLKKVTVGESSLQKEDLDLPGRALESRSKIKNQKVADLSVPQQKKLKKVRVGESSLLKEDLDLPGKTLESHSKIKNQSDRSLHTGARNDCIQTHSKKKKRSYTKLNGEDSKGDVQAGIPEGRYSGFEFAMDSLVDGTTEAAKEHYKETHSERVDGKINCPLEGTDSTDHMEKEIVADYVDGQVTAFSISRKTRKKKVRVGKGAPSAEDVDPSDDALGLDSKSPNEQVSAFSVFEEKGVVKKTKLKANSIQEKCECSKSTPKVVCALPALSSMMPRSQIDWLTTDMEVKSKRIIEAGNCSNHLPKGSLI